MIREHFHVIDIDPGFRIAEEGELKLLKQDVLEDLLEECYEERTEGFLEFVEKLGSGRNDRKLEELILQLYEYSRSYPQPEKWLRQCAQMYAPCAQGQPEGAGGQNLPNTPEAADAQDAPGRSEAADARDAAEAVSNGVQEPVYFRKAMAQVKQYLADVRELLTQGIRICEEPDGPYMYGDMLESDREMLEGILAADTFAGLYERILSANWKRLSAKKDESVSPEKRDQVKALRDQMKKLVKDLAATYFYERPEELLEDMESSYGVMKVFTEIGRAHV